MDPISGPPSGTSTHQSFKTQSMSAEDLLKGQTTGLVTLEDFRRRRAEAADQRHREARDGSQTRPTPGGSGTATPRDNDSDGALTPKVQSDGQPPKKKKKKKATRGPLSFANDVELESGNVAPTRGRIPPPSQNMVRTGETADTSLRGLAPNPSSTLPPPKARTKASIQAEALAREALRVEFLALQQQVRETEVLVPFVFYDGTNIPGGVVKMKKKDHIWLFLDRCRKVGAELGVGGAGPSSGISGTRSKDDSRRAWVRVGVDDLLCVRGEVIIPHHYELYYFIANKVPNPSKLDELLFNYSNTSATKPDTQMLSNPRDKALEGRDHDPNLTKVVDRRWYEKNKHIYPASMWKEYEAGTDADKHTKRMRTDAEGNAFFFS